MDIRIIPCGSLYVPAQEMIRGVPPEVTAGLYRIDRKGGMHIAMNALLVATGDRTVVFDPGCADWLPARLIESYGLKIDRPLELELKGMGYDTDEVTDVVFTHLHFDHCSGAFVRSPGKLGKRFQGARYHVLRDHYEYALRPDRQEGNSHAAKLLRYADAIHWLEDWEEDWMELKVFHGHTRYMTVPGIRTGERTLWFVNDLAPMEIFLRFEVSSGYDLEPELARKEKVEFLENLDPGSELVFYHDPHTERLIYP
jgi:glyoxylase-like metal-dependent hydrolase (beta-lactamase superfamily II)